MGCPQPGHLTFLPARSSLPENFLRHDGHDVAWVRTDAPGSTDQQVLARAVAEDRILLTFDKDFGDLAFRAGLPLIGEREPQLADIGCRCRPVPLVDQGVHVTFIVEARHRVIGLRFEFGVGDAAAGERLEHRKASAAQQAMDQRGDEHRLAGARQAGDAETDCRIEQIAAVFQQRLRRQAGFLDDVGKTGSHINRKPCAGRMIRHGGVAGLLHNRGRCSLRRWQL